jgi:hypothetical protein
MTIFIKGKEITSDELTQFTAKADAVIVSAWRESNIRHRFRTQDQFKQAIRRNRRAAKSAETNGLFTSRNHLFSTKSPTREETLYFRNKAENQTGRLRQQHDKGPLAKIDKKPKTHLFLSKKRFEELKEWHVKHKHSLPRTDIHEKKRKAGKRHIEFARTKKGISNWHPSGGTVTLKRDDLQHRIDRALKEILGIGRE